MVPVREYRLVTHTADYRGVVYKAAHSAPRRRRTTTVKI